jgi:hypothetical protein
LCSSRLEPYAGRAWRKIVVPPTRWASSWPPNPTLHGSRGVSILRLTTRSRLAHSRCRSLKKWQPNIQPRRSLTKALSAESAQGAPDDRRRRNEKGLHPCNQLTPPEMCGTGDVQYRGPPSTAIPTFGGLPAIPLFSLLAVATLKKTSAKGNRIRQVAFFAKRKCDEYPYRGRL